MTVPSRKNHSPCCLVRAVEGGVPLLNSLDKLSSELHPYTLSKLSDRPSSLDRMMKTSSIIPLRISDPQKDREIVKSRLLL
jgi:hypothetical protein